MKFKLFIFSSFCILFYAQSVPNDNFDEGSPSVDEQPNQTPLNFEETNPLIGSNETGAANWRKIYSNEQKQELINKFHQRRSEIKNCDKKTYNKIEKEIVKDLGVTRYSIYKWKKELGLSSRCNINYTNEEKCILIDEFYRRKNEFKNNEKINININKVEETIANELGVCRKNIYKWKKELGLSSVRYSHNYSKEQKIKIFQQFQKMKTEFKKNKEINTKNKVEQAIAKQLGVGRELIYKWIKELGFSKKCIINYTNEEKQNLIDEFHKRKSEFKKDEKINTHSKVEHAIAKELGVTRYSIYKWKNELGVSKEFHYSHNDSKEQKLKFVHSNRIYTKEEKLLFLNKFFKRRNEIENNTQISITYKIEENIAKELGFSHRSLHRWLNEFNFSKYNRSNTPPTNSEDVQGTSESYCEIIQNQETTNCSDEADPCEIIKEGFPKRCCRPRTKKTTNSSTERDLHGIIAEERYAKKRCSQRIKEIFESETNQPPPDNLRYPINEYISTNEFAHDNVILELSISEFTMEYIREFGLVRPLLFKEPPEKLGMRMPNPHEFSVLDVQELVGGEKQIHVFDVHTQKGKNMRMKEFVNYYKQNPAKRKKILNSISLEFSDTKLADKYQEFEKKNAVTSLVSAPALISEIDWVETVWPKELLARQKNLEQSSWARMNDCSTYPKVQKYCLMSVANCFTDFHIDFGGTSFWFHILKGEKIIWLIEPTENNLKLYEKWMLAGNDDTRFLGKLTKCTRVHLRQGDTLIVPSGWIHSVYTPVDSLVFVGNFLHSYSIPMQIRISHLEDRIQPEKIYRFPHFKQIFWAFIAQIVHKATHRIYQKKLPEEAHNSEGYRFSAPKNDQTAKNFVKIDDQWTRASLDGSTESGFSDSENDIENDFQSENNDAVSCQLNSDGHEICYDDLLGNAIDGSFTFNPIQTIYDNEDSAQFTATKNYDINFLRSLPPLVTNGLFPLLRYAEQLLTLKYPEVIEGITRPHHLVKEFRALLDKIHELGLHSDQ